MKRFSQKMFGRIAVTAVLILLQAAWLLVWFTRLAHAAPWVSTLFGVLSILIILYIVRKDDNPAYKIVWIILIFVVPLLGGLLYVMFGNKRPARRMREKFARSMRATRPLLQQDGAVLNKLAARQRATARYVAECGGYPVWENTSVTYYPMGEDMFAAMLRELEAAQHYILMEYFIICEYSQMWQQILAVLERKARQGVQVRVMYDDIGSVALLPGGYWRQLEAKGIQCLAFNPFVPLVSLVMNNRDHRKILVVDGHTAFTGGINLSDEYINLTHPHGRWKDTGVMLKGDAVWNFTLMFLQTWNAMRPQDEDFEAYRPGRYAPAPSGKPAPQGFVQPFGDSPLDFEPVAENVYIDILAQAKDYVYITTPYLVISNEMQTALCLAAKRGVDVRLVTPGIPDKPTVFRLTRSYYAALLRAGVRIYEYTPGFVHAKSYLADDTVGVVGTINMDFRSLYLHFECGTLMYGCPALLDLKRDMHQTFAASHEVHLADCHTGFWGALLSAVLRVFAPLF